MGRINWGARGLELILVALLVSIASQAPSSPSEEGVDGFSMDRAQKSLVTIATLPRPRGSQAHADVRGYLVQELEAMGVSVELQSGQFEPTDFISTRASGDDRGAAKHGDLVNVVGQIAGKDSSGTLLLMAHYDSVRDSPGAGDDGSGVVAVLEAMRALAANPPRNHVIALFTDGEEEGLRGATLFAEQHPLFGRVDVALNFESIGNGGPALMFETGPDSGGLIDLWAAYAPQPRGNTLAPVIYAWLPNDTDFSVFRDAGVRGLNFAIAGGSGAYHQPSDTPARIEPRALAHSARTAIALSSELGRRDLGQLTGGTRSFDSQPLLGAFSWRGRAHLWLAAGFILAWIVMLLRRPRLGPLAFLRGGLQGLLVASLAGLSSFLAGSAWLAGIGLGLPLSYNAIHLLLALMLGSAALAICLANLLWSGRKASRQRELWSASPLAWIALFGFFAWVDLGQLGAAYPIAWGVAGTCCASCLRLGGRSSFLAALALLPAIFEVGPILAQLLQLSSQDLDVSLGLGSVLIALGVLLVLPVVGTRSGN